MDRVLIVEDSRAMQRALERAFAAEGYQVDVASDGYAGLSSFREQRPSAVLLDLKLPGIHGRELCREFKASGSERACHSIERECRGRRQGAAS